jgi:hypothetical protein
VPQKAVVESTPMPGTGEPVVIPVAIGELVDKITILEIKAKRIPDPTKLLNIHAELKVLLEVWNRCGMSNAALKVLIKKLKQTNETLWAIENDIRQCERRRDFGPHFIELARGVYRNNDLRSALKREINERSGSAIIEEKSYFDG